MVKMGVQYSLWGGSVVNLGTEKHRAKYFDDIDSFRLPGCFAMTELRHGSNVAGLQVRQSSRPSETLGNMLPRPCTESCSARFSWSDLDPRPAREWGGAPGGGALRMTGSCCTCADHSDAGCGFR